MGKDAKGNTSQAPHKLMLAAVILSPNSPERSGFYSQANTERGSGRRKYFGERYALLIKYL